MGSSERRKGHNFERLIARCVRHLWPKACRGQQSHNPDAPDVDQTPYRIECKRIKRIAAMRYWEQADRDKRKAEDPRPAVVVMQEDRGPVMALLPFQDWLDLVQAKQDLQKLEDLGFMATMINERFEEMRSLADLCQKGWRHGQERE